MQADDFCVVLITVSNDGEGTRIAAALVNEGLAACVNIVPAVRSIYRWQGQLEYDDEVLLVAKSSRAMFDRLRERVEALHSYDVPEVIALDLDHASPGYAAFLRDGLAAGADD
jgi:periplasmic divalent cation tolerance protein